MASLLDTLMAGIRKAISKEVAALEATAPESQTRALTMEVIYNEICEQGHEMFPSGTYLAQIYLGDDGVLYALWNRESRLYRTPITVANGMITIGDQEEVRQEFTPVARTRVVLRELDNGDVRIFLVAGTAVVNRVGEIDSTTLFDNMIKRAQELNFYPRFDVYHLGSLSPAFEFGEVDFLARDGVAYIASGTLEGKHPLTRAILRTYQDNPNAVGASIEYAPLQGAYEDWDVGGVTIRTFLDGVNTRISIVFEEDAASWFTSMITGANDMKQRTLDNATKARLVKLFGDDEDALTEFLDGVGGIGRTVEELGLIHRDKADEAADDVEPEETGAEDDAVERTIEIDDETMTAIARQVVDMLGEKQLATVNGALEKLTGTVEKLAGSVQTLTKQQRTIGERLEALETDEDEKRREWVSDLPNRQKPAIKVTHRPRVERQVEEAEQDYAAIAEATLAALPDPLRPR